MEDQEQRDNQNTHQEQPNEPQSSDKKNTKSFVVWGLLVLVIAILATAATIMWDGGNGDDREVLAKIGESEITMEDIQSDFDQMKTQYEAQGMNLSENQEMRDMILYETLQNHVQQKLLMDHAEEKGLEVEEEDIEEEYNMITEQFATEEELDSALQQAGVSKDDLKQNIEDSLLIQLLAEEEGGEVEVSEEEINERYEQLEAQGGEDLPPLDEIREDLEQEVMSQKVNETLQSVVTELQEENEVEMLIEPPEPETPEQPQMDTPAEEEASPEAENTNEETMNPEVEDEGSTNEAEPIE
ncbi:MAG: SurA N-terminal domain-containing protein [Candidatus Paceibacterota bacterium]